MHLIPDTARSALAFVVTLGVLIFVHEMGHYLAARWRGVHVEAFSIGFGRALASWRDRRGTVWKLAWLPLGGYVKLHGQEQPEDVSDEVRAGWIPGRTFHEKSVLSRAIVVAAGPLANFALAALVFMVLFAAMGRPILPPVFGTVKPDSPAARAGLQAGDRVLSINGEATARFEDIQRITMANPDRPLSLRLVRDGREQTVEAVAGSRAGAGGRRDGELGVGNAPVEYVHLGLGQSVVAGVTETWDMVVRTLAGLGQMLNGTRGTDELSGPIGIFKLSGQAAQYGIASLAGFIALLSINLALINLFPIPILDGGHLVFYAIEAVRGRPLSPRAQEYGFRAGAALLACLFVFVTWNDLMRSGLFRWVSSLIG